MVCELKITSWCKKIVYKFRGDPTFRQSVISEKQSYAADEIHSSIFYFEVIKFVSMEPIGLKCPT